MKKIKILSITGSILILFSILLSVSSCSNDLDDMISDSYRSAFDNVDKNKKGQKVRIPDNIYQDCLKLFADKDIEVYGDAESKIDDHLRERWDYVLQVLRDNNFENEEIEKADSNQWLHPDYVLPPVLVDVYLDNTESMMGYLHINNDHTFSNSVNFVKDYCDNFEYKDLKGHYVMRNNNKTEVTTLNWEEFSSQVSHSNVPQSTDTYSLTDFLETVCKTIQEDKSHRHLCVFVTDGIPSGTNSQIGGQQQWTEKESTRFTQNLREIVKKIEGDCAISVYQDMAQFSGKYICYNNQKDPYTGQRPFYVITIGTASLVEEYKDYLNEMMKSEKSIFVPQKQVHFIHQSKASDIKPITEIFVEGDKENEYILDESYIEDSDKVEPFDIRFPLTMLSDYMQDTLTAKKAVEIFIDKKKEDYSFVTSDDEINILVSKVRMENEQFTLQIKVKDISPDWIKESTSTDDIIKKTGTFGLQWVIDGLQQGVFGNKPSTIDKTFLFRFPKK